MELLRQTIRERAVVRPGDVLKVDSFLNHQIDIDLLGEVGREFYQRFKSRGITKVLTIEASGIAIAVATAQYFDVPVVFAKKHQTKNLDGELLSAPVTSFTHGRTYDVTVEKKFLPPEDTVLIVDDFLAKGSALSGLCDIVERSGAKVGGIGIVIEKGFDVGGGLIRARGYDVQSLACIKSMSEQGIVFDDAE